MQNSIGSVTSTDSGYGQGFERLDRNHSESPQLPPRRRYQHYHRQHHHGKHGASVGLSLHHAVPVEVSPTSSSCTTGTSITSLGSAGYSWDNWTDQAHGPEFYPGRSAIIPRVGVHRVSNRASPQQSNNTQSFYLQANDEDDDETQVSAV